MLCSLFSINSSSCSSVVSLYLLKANYLSFSASSCLISCCEPGLIWLTLFQVKVFWLANCDVDLFGEPLLIGGLIDLDFCLIIILFGLPVCFSFSKCLNWLSCTGVVIFPWIACSSNFCSWISWAAVKYPGCTISFRRSSSSCSSGWIYLPAFSWFKYCLNLES